MCEKKKIGILSFYYKNENCGGQLQAYALCRALTYIGYDSEQICYESELSVSNEGLKEKVFRHFKEDGFIKTLYLIGYYAKEKFFLNRGLKKNKYARDKAFSPFEEQTPHSKYVFHDSDFRDATPTYDAFITGSDQVWSWVANTFVHTDGRRDKLALDAYMLRFVPDEVRKLSYAASISCPCIPDDLKAYYNESIMRLDAASIREQSSLTLFPEEVRKHISVVLDPTLLLTRGQWDEALALGDRTIEKPFIFLYLLGPSKEDRKTVKKIARKFGLPIVTRPDINMERGKDYDKHLADIEDYNMGPKEFVRYIRDAALVITNSFHAAVFSLNFHTPFYVIKRDSKVSMHSRIESVANDYDVGDRVLNTDFDANALTLDGIDWNHVDAVLEEKRAYSYDFLKRGIEG